MWNDWLSHTQALLPSPFSFLPGIAWVCRMSIYTFRSNLHPSSLCSVFWRLTFVNCNNGILFPLASNRIPQMGLTGWRRQQENEARTFVPWAPSGNTSFHGLTISEKMLSRVGEHLYACLSLTIGYISSAIHAKIQKLGTKFQLLLIPRVLDYLLVLLESILPKPCI